MKITVDTNILISATFWYGDSNEIIEKAESKEFELILSPEIIQEYSEVLNYKEIQDKIRNKNLEMRKSVEKITAISTIVQSTQKVEVIKDDPDDNQVLECAKAGNVDYIITIGNNLNFRMFEIIVRLFPNKQITLE